MNIKKILPIFILIFIILTPICEANNQIQENKEKSNITNNTKEKEKENENILKQKLELFSTSAILIDGDSGKEIYSKDANKRMNPASTTKVMTAILTLERGNLDDITTVKKDAISIIPYGYSAAYLSEGEKISVRSLLETLLVHSANDSANVLAEYISGSIDKFVDLMNQKAIELGCKNTHFVNTNGVHDENHYSTAHDLAIIAKYCMQNPIFRNMVSMKKCDIPATNKFGLRSYINTNDSIIPTSKYYRKDVIGIKTGYTSQAKNCIISSARDKDTELIAVLLYSPHLPDRYADLDTLFDYGYKAAPLLKAAEEEKQKETIVENNDSNNNKEQNIIAQTDTEKKSNNNFQLSLNSFLNTNNYIIILISVLITIIFLLIIFTLMLYRITKKEKKIKFENFE